MSKYSTKRLKIIGLCASLCAGLIVGYIWLNSQSDLNTPSWNGITPGETPLEDVYDLLGEVDEVDLKNNYLIHIYERREDLGWGYVNIYAKPNENTSAVVVAIELSTDFRVKSPSPLTLQDIILRYGKPRLVQWSETSLARCLLWPEQGVVVTAGVWPEDEPWDENIISMVTYHEPYHSWQDPFSVGWGDCSYRNWHRDPNERDWDWLPQDPYDWDDMPE